MTVPRRLPGLPRLGAPARASRIAVAEANLAALAADYPALAAGTLEELRAAWEASRADPADATARSQLFRLAHSLKGEGASFGYPLVTAIGTSLCLVLEHGHARHPAAFPSVEAHVVALEGVLAARLGGSGGEVGARLLLALRDRVAEGKAAIAEAGTARPG